MKRLAAWLHALARTLRLLVGRLGVPTRDLPARQRRPAPVASGEDRDSDPPPWISPGH